MQIWKNYRIKLYPTTEQFEKLMSICHTYRYVYNWGLSFCNDYRHSNLQVTPSFYAMSDAFTVFRRTHPWLQDFDINTCRYALMDVVTAFKCFMEHRARYPKFKSKKNHNYGTRKFQVRGDRLTFWGQYKEYVHIPGFGRFKKDYVYCGKNHNIPIGGGISYHNVFIRYDGLDFWLSMSVLTEVDDPKVNLSSDVVGIDVGIRTAATLSNGVSFDGIHNPRLLLSDKRIRTYDRLLEASTHRRERIAYSTKTKYENIPKSKNDMKRDRKRIKAHKRIRNIYSYNYHIISKAIAGIDCDTIVVEDLKIRNMIHEYKFSRKYIQTGRLGLLLMYIHYKCENAGKTVIKAPDDFPSTQMCSRCGHLHKVGPGKIYNCPNCGLQIDRDLNAALNLRAYGLSVQTA